MAAEDLKQIHAIQELFHGRFEEDEIGFFFHHCNDDQQQTVLFMLGTEPGELTRLLDAEHRTWTTVERLRRIKQRSPGIVQTATSGKIDTTVRQFGCLNCDNFWWRRCPGRKQLSMCNRCRNRFEPVARNREWGWAIFNCHTCNREFHGWGQMELVASPCYSCGTPVIPTRILPPNQRGAQRTRSQHTCLAPDCCGNRLRRPPTNFQEVPGAPTGVRVTCVHPASRRHNGLPTVVEPSNIHASSGSTVDTFLSQSDMNQRLEIVFPPATIPEEGSDEGGST